MSKIDAIAKALASEDKEISQSRAKDEARLAKPEYQTKIQPIHEDTKRELKGWKPPRGAYILFEKRYWELSEDLKEKHGLFILSVEARPDIGFKLDQYCNDKKYRILDWGNFPQINDRDPKRAAMAKAQIDPQTGKSAWASLEDQLNSFSKTNDIAAKNLEIDQLKAKLALAENKKGNQATE